MEIVSEPDMRSPEEARAYLVKLRADPALHRRQQGEHGGRATSAATPTSRCGRAGTAEFGTKVEVKNMNSFRAVVQRAASSRSSARPRCSTRGERIAQETRGWVEDRRRHGQPALEGAGPRLSLLPRARPAADDARRRRRRSDPRAAARNCPMRSTARFEARLRPAALRGAPAHGDASPRRLLRARAVGCRRQATSEALDRYARADRKLDDRRLRATAARGGIGDRRSAGISRQNLYAYDRARRERHDHRSRSPRPCSRRCSHTGKPAADVVQELGLEQISGADEIGGIVEGVIAGEPKGGRANTAPGSRRRSSFSSGRRCARRAAAQIRRRSPRS